MRTRNSWITVLIVASAAMGWVSTAHSAANCVALYDKIRAAGDTVAPQTIKQFHQQAEKLPDCDANFRLALGRRVAVSILTQVDEALKAGSSTATQKPALEESLKYHPMWVALAMLGDIASEDRDHAQATKRYQEALQVIDDPEFTKKPPAKSTIKRIVKKAETTRMLASSYVAAPRTRGKPTGLGALRVRGFKIETVAIPVTFKFGTTEFTREGAAAAADLLVQLNAQGKPNVTLVGHTDPVGSHAANQVLSERRARALADYLRKQGYSGTIKTAGHGETRQFAPDDPKRYSRDELHQMSRRVELVR